MGFGQLFTKGLASSGANSLTGLITGGISQALGLSWSPQRTMREQEAYNKRIMALQNQYQQQAAAQSQQYAKDYWDYTNTENQVAHLKNSGLNIGLMYGQSGAGGMGASGGARQESPEQAQGNPVGMALQTQQIEQQRRMNDAQIALAEAQASKAKEEAKKIGGVDTQEAYKRMEEIASRIELNLREGNYKDALTDLTKVEKEATEALKSLRNMQEGLTNAQISEAFAIAGYYSEKTHTEYWVKENEKIENKYLKDTYYDRVNAAYYNNAVAIALAAKYKSDKDVNEEQIEHLQASIKELEALADKHNWDKETYRKQVIGMINRWEEQTFNERIGLGLEFGEKIVNMLYKGRGRKASTKTKSTKEGNTTTTETYTESY
jgi:HPt (histidine-containing phosphotransfer) domain-containing protein